MGFLIYHITSLLVVSNLHLLSSTKFLWQTSFAHSLTQEHVKIELNIWFNSKHNTHRKMKHEHVYKNMSFFHKSVSTQKKNILKYFCAIIKDFLSLCFSLLQSLPLSQSLLYIPKQNLILQKAEMQFRWPGKTIDTRS